jgi:hypothetical protein
MGLKLGAILFGLPDMTFMSVYETFQKLGLPIDTEIQRSLQRCAGFLKLFKQNIAVSNRQKRL